MNEFQLGDEERYILRSLPRYHCLTEQQIRRLVGRTSRSSFHPILKRLVANGYLMTPKRRLLLPHAYFLTAKGCTIAEAAGVPVSIRRKPSDLEKVTRNDLAHTLLVNHALIGFQLLCQHDPSWLIAASTHERDFKVRPFLLPNGHALAPDGWIELHQLLHQTKKRYWFALEIQGESHWTSTTIREKVRKYIILDEQDRYKAYFSLPDQAVFWVLFLTTSGEAETEAKRQQQLQRRVQVIKAAIERELTAQHQEDLASLFLVAPLLTEGIVYNEPVWHQPFRQGEKTVWEWLET